MAIYWPLYIPSLASTTLSREAMLVTFPAILRLKSPRDESLNNLDQGRIILKYP